MNESDHPNNATITEYEDLNPQMQELFHEARDGSVSVGHGTPDWYESVRYVEYEGDYYDMSGVYRHAAVGGAEVEIGTLLILVSGLYFTARASSRNRGQD